MSPVSSTADPRDLVRLALQKLFYKKYPRMLPTVISQNVALIERLLHQQRAIKHFRDLENATKLQACLKHLILSLTCKNRKETGKAYSMPKRRNALKSKLGGERYVKALALCRQFYALRYRAAKLLSCARCKDSVCEYTTFCNAKKVFSNPPLLYALEGMPLHEVCGTRSDEWDAWMKEVEEIVENC
ncbi:hypothetical protein FisN_14Lh162 [Fistulifera solaris]|uniref:Uncharacterized protein n=1 Tax=Fistulifera solaris TaxID=1519565 RepID=A0A1Z5J9H4_FISSO|nr:hypothetical protein FisN_14Lh162 [Fistulifera solaris]|eukprot:GAX10654.1 hypothetical protein FisN_14Lh162 [Fistulifera solaris]